MSVIIPQTDPRANYHAHRAEIDAAIAAVLEGGRYILGEQVTSFEREFAAYLGVRHAIGVGSGTDALHLALRACGMGPGLPVFTVAHTAVATVAAVEMCGATPVLVDINPADFTMDPQLEGVEEASQATDVARCRDQMRVRLGIPQGRCAVPRPYRVHLPRRDHPGASVRPTGRYRRDPGDRCAATPWR